MTGQERRGKYRNRWRQMIAQEENEITSRAGKVKSLHWGGGVGGPTRWVLGRITE